MNLSKMNFTWFKRVGFFYIPISLTGWLVLSFGFAYAIYSFIVIDKGSHSVSDMLINFVFRLLIICAVYSLIAFLSGRKPKN